MGDATSGWTTSARWERRTAKEAKALHKHEARVDDRDLHSNPNIDPSRTSDNEVWVNDGTGRLVEATEPGAWGEAIDRNLARVAGARYDEAEQQWYDRVVRKGKTGERKRASNRTEVMDVVLMLDPDYTGPIRPGWYQRTDPDTGLPLVDDDGRPITEWREGMDAEQRAEAERLLMVMVQTVADKVGPENLVGVSIQWDETHPHAHLQLTPITEDGRLDWKGFIDGPAATSAFHDQFRLDLQEAGYNATMERVSSGQKHLPQAKYKRVKDHERSVKLQEARNAARTAELDQGEAKVTTAAQKLVQDRRTAAQHFDDRQAELDAIRAEALQDRQEAADARLRAQEAARASEVTQQVIEAQREALAAQQAAQDKRQAELDARDAEPPLWQGYLRSGITQGGKPYDQRARYQAYVQRQRRTQRAVDLAQEKYGTSGPSSLDTFGKA